MRDYWVDGHFITAPDERGARAEVARLYGYEPEEVRPWDEDDQRELEDLDPNEVELDEDDSDWFDYVNAD